MKLTLKVKVNIAIIAAFILIALVFVAIEFPFQKQRIKSTQENVILVLKTMVERDMEPLANEIFDNSIRSIDIRLEKMMQVKGVFGIIVFNAAEDQIATKGIIHPLPNPSSYFDLSDSYVTHVRTATLIKRNFIDYISEIKVIGERIGFIHIHYSLEEIEREQNRALMIFTGLLTTVFIVLTILLNLILSETIIRPITDLRDAMEKIRLSGTNEQVILHKNDEIGDLAESFNHMATELTRSYSELEKQNLALIESEKKIHTVQQYLKNIIDSMPSILAGVDIDGRITQWNTEAEQATGITASKAKGQFYSVVLPWAMDLPLLNIRDSILRKKVWKKSKINVVIHEEPHYIDITIFPLMGETIHEAVLRLDDVTELVKMEEMMIQSEKMLSVGGLAAGMAHEINNPLAGMIQTADVLRNRLMGYLPASITAAEECGTDIETIMAFMDLREIPKMLDNIHSSGLIAAQIVKNMLSFARKNDQGKIMCNLATLLDDTLSLASSEYDLKKKYDFKKIQIYRRYDENAPDIPCEPGQIQQVFLNILTNGAQAMFHYRQIAPESYLPVFTCTIRMIHDRSMVRIEIKDNGPGMDESIRKRVFEPFFTTKEQGEGTGLGLSVSYFIITENHGGEMHVESSPNAGTTFFIDLPVTRPNRSGG